MTEYIYIYIYIYIVEAVGQSRGKQSCPIVYKSVDARPGDQTKLSNYSEGKLFSPTTSLFLFNEIEINNMFKPTLLENLREALEFLVRTEKTFSIIVEGFELPLSLVCSTIRAFPHPTAHRLTLFIPGGGGVKSSIPLRFFLDTFG